MGEIGTTPKSCKNAIEVRDLRKSFGKVRAVAGVNLTVRTGEVFALLGPNGAGKTTTVEIMEGLEQRDSGEVRLFGEDPAKKDPALKARIGIVAQETVADPFLTAIEMVEMIAGSYPRAKPADDALALVGLTDKRRVRVGRLSGGQKRRLDVALALVGDPDLLFLDEPTTGFDPDARHEAWELVRNLRTLGKTILLTTHYMDEAQQLADRVAVIADGHIISEGTPDTIGGRAEASTKIRFRTLSSGLSMPDKLRQGLSQGSDGTFQLQSDDPVSTLHALTGWALESGHKLEGLEVTRPSLEDTYRELIARSREASVTETA